jgi:hypothetical protein
MTRARDMANLGSQAGSGLDASDITSGVLPSGVTGGSGLTALASNPTVTLGSNATFPAGHIIQVETITSNERTTTTSSAWDAKWTYSQTITPNKASSNIWLCATFQCYASGGQGYFDFYKNASDVTATFNLSGLLYGNSGIHYNSGWTTTSATFLDPVAENSITEKTYSISGRSDGQGTTYIGGGANAGVTLTIMEIAT